MGEYADYEIEREMFGEDDLTDGDMYAYLNEIKKKKRKNNTEWSTDFLKKNKVPFESKNHGAHLIVCGVYDFWPSSGLFIDRKHKKRSRGVKNLVKILNDNGLI